MKAKVTTLNASPSAPRKIRWIMLISCLCIYGIWTLSSYGSGDKVKGIFLPPEDHEEIETKEEVPTKTSIFLPTAEIVPDPPSPPISNEERPFVLRLYEPTFSLEDEPLPHRLIPIPNSLTFGSGDLLIDSNVGISFHLESEHSSSDLMKRAIQRMLSKMVSKCGVFGPSPKDGAPLFTLSWREEIKLPHLDMPEDYSLSVDPDGNRIDLKATSNIGIYRGMETFLQMINADINDPRCRVPSAMIQDKPKYKWRGIMIDVARHFHNATIIKANIDAMAMVKMNVLHLHLSDDQGFRFESKKYPKLQECGGDGRLGSGQYFRQDELREIVDYAAERGVRVIPEIDVPGHVSSWCGYPQYITDGVGSSPVREYGVFHFSLDPSQEETFEMLRGLFTEISEVFPDDYIHLGGDEVTGGGWTRTPRINQWMRKQGMSTWKQLQDYFSQKMEKIIKDLKKIPYGWQEMRSDSQPGMLLQTWMGSEPEGALNRGHPQIYSRNFYLDWTSYLSFYYSQQVIEHPTVYGGEACQWSEYVESETLDSRIWPSASGIAELLWTNKVADMKNYYLRANLLQDHFERSRIGLRHRSYLEPMMKRLAGEHDHIPLMVLTNVLKNDNRVQTDGYHTLKPLTDLIDTIAPESMVAWKFNRLMNTMVTSKENFNLYKEVARRILNDWKVNHDRLLPLLNNPPTEPGRDIGPALYFSSILSDLGKCGLEAIDYLDGKGNSPNPNCRNLVKQGASYWKKTRIDITGGIETLINKSF